MSAGTQPRPDEPNPVLTPEQQAAAMLRLEARVTLAMRQAEHKATELQAATVEVLASSQALLRAVQQASRLSRYPKQDARIRRAGD